MPYDFEEIVLQRAIRVNYFQLQIFTHVWQFLKQIKGDLSMEYDTCYMQQFLLALQAAKNAVTTLEEVHKATRS